MKKCPTCDKTFDDKLKFCQTDGTLLVDDGPAEDPFKTTVAKKDDLPIPPIDPFKTMVAGPIPPVEPPEPPPVEEIVNEEPEIDPLKTIVSSDFPSFDKNAGIPKAVDQSEPDIPPPSPFDQPNATPEPPAAGVEDISVAPPSPPQFSEPDLNPPTFGDSPAATPPPFVEAVSDPSPPDIPPADEKPPAGDTPAPDFPQPPFGKPENVPIPSPFDQSMAPGYQAPQTPMPPYKDAGFEDQKADIFNTPFAEQSAADQQMAAQGWSPPPAPEAGWQNQDIGMNTPFQPPMSGIQGNDQTLAIIALACGILSIPCCGLLSGIPAVIMGFIAKNNAENNPEQYTGRGLALAGIITGAIGTVLSIIVIILQILLGVLGNL